MAFVFQLEYQEVLHPMLTVKMGFTKHDKNVWISKEKQLDNKEIALVTIRLRWLIFLSKVRVEGLLTALTQEDKVLSDEQSSNFCVQEKLLCLKMCLLLYS